MGHEIDRGISFSGVRFQKHGKTCSLLWLSPNHGRLKPGSATHNAALGDRGFDLESADEREEEGLGSAANKRIRLVLIRQ
jgi:hypothetical protein